MRRLWIFAVLLLSVCATAFAQTLEIPAVTVERGSANILRIVLRSRAEKPIAALQWNLVYRDGLRIEPSGVVPGSVSEATGKSVTCARRQSDGANRITCILAGGVQVLGAGVIAIVRFEAPKDNSTGDGIIGLEKVVGVSPTLEPVPIQDVKASIAIR